MAELFLYQAPFVLTSKEANTFQHPELFHPDRMTEEFRQDEILFRGTLLSFAVNNNLVETKKDHFVLTTREAVGSVAWAMCWHDFRALTHPDELENLLITMKGDSDNFIGKVLDLHARLGMMFDHAFLNTLCHRIISAIRMIPYGSNGLRWPDIHIKYPFIWILLATQMVMRTEARIPST